MYLHINKATSRITKCSPIKPRDPDVGYAEAPPEIAELLAAGNLNCLKRYFVLCEGDTYVLKPNEVVSVMANTRVASTELVEVLPQPNAEFDIIINNAKNRITFKLNRFHSVAAQAFVGNTLSGNFEPTTMYFTKKNDPSYLLFFFDVPLEELLTVEGNSVSYPLPVACSSVSVYTKLILNSYSLEIL